MKQVTRDQETGPQPAGKSFREGGKEQAGGILQLGDSRAPRKQKSLLPQIMTSQTSYVFLAGGITQKSLLLSKYSPAMTGTAAPWKQALPSVDDFLRHTVRVCCHNFLPGVPETTQRRRKGLTKGNTHRLCPDATPVWLGAGGRFPVLWWPGQLRAPSRDHGTARGPTSFT